MAAPSATEIDARPERIQAEPEYLADLRAPFRRIREQKAVFGFGGADLKGLRQLKAAGVDAVLENIRPGAREIRASSSAWPRRQPSAAGRRRWTSSH